MAETLDLDALKGRYGAPVVPTMDLDALKARYGAPTGTAAPEPPAPARPEADRLQEAQERFGGKDWQVAVPTGYQPPKEAPLQESFNPLELGISGLSAKATLGATRYFWPKAGKLAQLVAQGLGLEVGHKVNQATGNTPGSLLDFGWPDVFNFTMPALQEGVVQVGKTVLSAGRAGQAVKVADAAQGTYDTAVGAHANAVQTARAIPKDMAGETPSWVLYQQVRDAAPDTLVDMVPLRQTASDLLAAPRAAPLPATVTTRLTKLSQGDPSGTIATAHEVLQEWGPLTRSANGEIRNTAHAMMDSAHQTIREGAQLFPEQAPVVASLDAARAAYRHERALGTVDRMRLMATRTANDNTERFNPGQMLTQLDRRYEQDALFRGSFKEGEFETLRAGYAALTKLPTVPAAPGPPTIQDYGTDTYRRLGEIGTSIWGAFSGEHPVHSLALGTGVGLGVAAADKGYDAFSRWLLSPKILPYFRQAIGPSGDLNHQTMAVLNGLFTSGRQPESPATPTP